MRSHARHGPGSRLIAAAVSAWLISTSAQAAPPAEDEAVEPSDAQAAADAGDAATEAGDFHTALREYKRAKELDPNIDVDESLAQSHFGVGMASYEAGRYSEALEHFQDAQGLYPSPNFHYNIAQCYEALEREQQAIDSYRAFLRAVPDTPDRANIESKIGRLEKRIREAEQEANNRQPVGPAPAPAPVQTQPADEPKSPGRVLIISGGVLTGLGVAVAAGGGTSFGLTARDRSNAVEEVFEGGNPDRLSFGEAQQLDEEGRSAQTGQIISLVVGGAVTAVGVALMAVGLVEKKRKRERNVAAIPSVGTDGAGLILRGRF